MNLYVALLLFYCNYGITDSTTDSGSNTINLKTKQESRGLEKIIYVPYEVGMELGSGFDHVNDVVKPNLIEESARTKIAIADIDSQNSYFSWKMVKTMSDVRDMLGITGRVSLSVGEEDIAGSSVAIEGFYKSDVSTKSNEVTIAAVFRYNTRSETIPDAAIKGRVDCTSLSDDVRGTHFVRSIVHGGEMVASIKISMSSKKDMDQYGGSIKASSVIGYSFNAYLEFLESVNETEVRTDVRIISACGIQIVPTNIDDFKKLIKFYPTFMKAQCPNSHPLQAELVPINHLQACLKTGMTDAPNLKVNDWQLRPIFDFVAVLYDDVRFTRKRLTEVLLSFDTIDVAPEKLNMVKELDMDLMTREMALLEARNKLKSGNPQVLINTAAELKKVYEEGTGSTIPRHFENRLLKIRDGITSCPHSFQRIEGNCYRHFSTPKSWIDATVRCARYGGYLASFTEKEIVEFHKKNTIRTNYWIGLNRTHEGIYSWNNGEALDYLKVSSRDPFMSGFHCLEMTSSNGMTYDLCSTKKNFACRVSITD